MKQSIVWLNSLENSNIQHALNGGEIKICGAKVDGYDSETKTVYQYHGCFWHGCPSCYHEESVNNVNKIPMGDLYEKTVKRTELLREAGFNVIEMWQCRFVKSKMYKNYKNSVNFEEPLNPRDAYFGGRTEVFKLKATSNSSHKIKYVDVCSLYPTVMYSDECPSGHPVKIIRPTKYDEKWFGIIKCTVLPPKKLYVPVLPFKIKTTKSEKLLFPLCRKCAETQTGIKNCEHSEIERQLLGTWSTVEVKKALEKGYKILDIAEVWHFQKTTSKLFKKYINDFMKLKLESSPHNYPSNQAYADDIKLRQGIELDMQNIKPNPVKRTTAKTCMNSLYGRFGMRTNQTHTEFVTDPSRFYELLLDDRLDDLSIFYLTDDMIQVNYRYKDYFIENRYNVNIFVALYTTANARLRLYEELDRLGTAACYCDTDSIIYLDDGSNSVKTGDLLGDWTDELGKNVHIEKFIATGPKSYYYITNQGKVVTKVKGFTLNHKNAQKINGEILEKMVDREIQQVKIEENRIFRDTTTKQLVNKNTTKTLSFNFDKRNIDENYDTLPFGF